MSQEHQPFAISSPNFADGARLPDKYSCEAKPFATGESPALKWTKGPKGTKSYAIVFSDSTLIGAGNPNYGFHWAIWNIAESQHAIPEGIPGVDPSAPTKIVPLPDSLAGAEHSQARGLPQFFGPCPSWKTYCTDGTFPRSNDRYSFTVYALAEEKLSVPAYLPEVNPNYVDTLNAFFADKALDKATIQTTSEAKPISLPFPCPEE